MVLVAALGAGWTGSIGFFTQQQAKIQRDQQTGDVMRLRQDRAQPALGASGAVMGLGALATCFAPKLPMQLMFIPIGIPLWVVTLGYAAIDMFYLDAQNSKVAHSGHLGGLLFGLMSYAVYFRRFGGIFGRRF